MAAITGFDSGAAQRALVAARPGEIVGAGAQLLEVGAGAEGAAGAGQHGHAGLGIGLEGFQRRGQAVRGLVVERVLRLRGD